MTARTTLAGLLLCTAALAASPAMAQGHGHGNGHNPKAQGRHDNGKHLGWQKQAWKRGEHLPRGDYDGYYVDYREYHLAPPPRGYRWVRPVDDRYLLVEVATGLIAEALGY
ncbi:RcnB family protein [Pseudoxanthomonas sp. JBR18]|uniref:RcnB family protein n=1 Tax=Pseudoxanthomonas sp. JBR18 TaxID=2969308 RepID=UPI002306D3BD|nr:RcnB family protein [Pseudoxanthomonas sp. JBR18]WCE02580.1 RcnB family protein [Pseudoxanthomonas sp. JBR18]